MYADLPIETIEHALSFISPDMARDDWVQIGMAIKSELGDSDGFDVFDRWSAGCDTYNRRDAQDTWRSIKQGGGITIASLIHAAQQSGYRPEAKAPTLSPDEINQRRSKREADAKREIEQRERRYVQAAAEAVAIWDAAQPVAECDHAYLQRKGITEPGKIRQGNYRRWVVDGYVDIPGALLIPIRDADNQLTSVQAIFPDADNVLERDRDYLPGGRKNGCYFNIGRPTGEIDELVTISEGYANGATCGQLTDALAVIAFDAGNLTAVAAIIRMKLPHARIVICADNDQFTKKRDGTPHNPGIEAAAAACAVADALLAVPVFADLAGEPTDFSDLYLREGVDRVVACIDAAAKPAANDNVSQPDAPARMPAPRSFSLDAFGDPIDVFGVRAPPEMPIDVLPAAFQSYVLDQSELTGCDPAIIGMTALASAAACIDDSIRLQPKRQDPTWNEEPRLWVAFVGDPSTKKSPAIAKGVRHAKRIDHRWSEENDAAFGDWQHQHDDWKDAKKQDKSLEEPKKPAMKRLVVEDITVEALSEVLKDNPRGVLVLKDELTGWFASMDAYKGGGKGASMDRAHWLEAYQGGTHAIDRIGRGRVRVPNWSACIIGGIQPDMIRRVASSMGNDGLLQRFMVICARAAVQDADRVPNMRAMEEFSGLFDHLVSIKAGVDPIRLSDAAHESRLRIASYARRLILAFDQPHMQAWLGKWDGLYGRLLATYHVIECATARKHPSAVPVAGETAEQVERLMMGTLLPHAIHFYAEILDANERHEHVRQLARLILAKNFDRITKRDITLMWKASRRMEWWEVRTIIDNLCTMDWLRPDMDAIDTDGKARAWHVNPAAHEIFARQAEREQARRTDAIDAIREARAAYG